MQRSVMFISGLAAAALAVSLWAGATLADESRGRCRVVEVNGRVHEGEVTESGDIVRVKHSNGITITLKKPQVREITPLGEAAASAGADAAEAVGKLSPDQLKEILGAEENFAIIEEYGETSSNAMEPAPRSEEGLRQMLTVAGEKADFLETDHFLLVYTSPRKLAVELGARLESVYYWNIKFMEYMGVPSRRPDYKLEIYFFGTHEEFKRYAALDLGMSETGGILGFYMAPTNRSAFFDMMDFEPYARVLEGVKSRNVPAQERRRVTNMITRLVEFNNLEVVQHEAAHHIHFNVGLFNPRADRAGRWLSEGMAVQFEVPKSQFGASLGSINYNRLRQVRQIWGGIFTEDGSPPMDFMRAFLWQGSVEYTGAHYSLGWGVIHYLRTKFPDQFGNYLRAVAEWEDDVEVPITDKQKLWEDNFGTLDEDWVKKFRQFIFKEMVLKEDQLPPDLP